MNTTMTTQPMLRVLFSVAGLVVWAGHFTAIYAISALACERGLATRTLFGLPWVPVLVCVATLLALVLLGLVMRPAFKGLAAPPLDGGEAEPGFTRWFAASTALLAALAVVFETLPVLILPGCG